MQSDATHPTRRRHHGKSTLRLWKDGGISSTRPVANTEAETGGLPGVTTKGIR